MQGDLEAIQKDEAAYGPIPPDIKEAIGLTPDASRLTPNLQPKVVVWGTGTPRREFLYSDDMAAATIFLVGLPDDKFLSLLTPHSSPLINIGCGEDQTIAELAKLVKTVVGFRGELLFDESKPDGTPRKLLAVGHINKLGWKAQTSLQEGIRQAYEDYLHMSLE
jgi:GDP-L-fucose synthase